MELSDHPTVTRLAASPRKEAEPIDAAGLRRLALDCGADDVGLVEIARPGLDPQRDELLRNYPWTGRFSAPCAWRASACVGPASVLALFRRAQF
jgi:hypothetical protein